MDHALAVYLPLDRRHALATGTPLLERTQGATLFADISGFTPLTEALTRDLGPRRGAEELPRQLNLVYDALIREVDRYGGSVIGFAGDAITCWFDGDSGLRSTACGLAMQQVMQTFATVQLPSGGTASLAMKVAVAAGTVRRFLVGDPRVQLLDVLAGATLTRMAAAEHMAEKGEVVLDDRTAYALGESLEVQAWRTDESENRFAVVAGLRAMVDPQPWAPLTPGTLRPDDLRPWLLPTVYERLQAGQGEFLTELRPAVALFLRFGGIDYDNDPEAGQKLDQYIRWVQSVLAQYEGTLIQLTIGEKGSYLYAAFGAPIAHEDDARRAALTALKLRKPPEELAFITETQSGLTRGTMRTGAYGGSTRRTYGSLGDEVNLAARLMQAASPGEIIASARVQAATETLFAWRERPAIRVKGKSEPIAIFALMGTRRAATIHLQEPSYTLPMVGRAAELALIDQKVAQVLSGQGQIVGITAEAGMGKSRLVAEVIRRATSIGLTGYGGECQSFGTNTPYLVWQPLWRAFFALDETLPSEEQQATLAADLARLNPSLLPRLPLLGSVLNLPLPENELTRSLSAEQRKQSREALLVDLLKARAASTPILLVLEDAHWLDPLSQELLDSVGRALSNVPVLIVLAYRPPEAHGRPAPQALGLPYFTEISLDALTPAEAAQLIDAKLTERRATHYEALPRTVVEQLMARTEGNPFYIEELLNYLHEQGLDLHDPTVLSRLDLPTSLHALILSRIDQLTEPQKITMKVASVIGRLFRVAWLHGYYPALGESTEIKAHLEELRRLDLTPLEQPEPELTYLFKHIVTQEVAYESLAFATRAVLHEQLARFIEGLPGEAASLDLLAYHYERSENLEKKCYYLRRAGESAQAAFANSAAQSYYKRLLPLLQDSDERLDVHLKLGSVLERVGQWDEAERHYQAALSLAPTSAQVGAKAQSLLALGKLLEGRGQSEEAEAILLQALSEWEGVPEGSRAANETLTELGLLLTQMGDRQRARGYLERSCEQCGSENDQVGLAHALSSLGGLFYVQGDYSEAQPLLEESLARRRELGDKPGIVKTLGTLGMLNVQLGRYATAEGWFGEALTLCQEMGDKYGIARCLMRLGNATTDQQRYEVAWKYYEDGLALFSELGSKEGIASCLLSFGNVALNQGKYEQAREYLEESLIQGREVGRKSLIVISLGNLGGVAYRQGDAVSARGYFEESLVLAQEILQKWAMLNAVIGLAAAISRQAIAQCAHDMAALLSAAEVQRQAMDSPLEPDSKELYDDAMNLTQAHLSEADFAAAWARGKAMSWDEAMSLALAIPPQAS